MDEKDFARLLNEGNTSAIESFIRNDPELKEFHERNIIFGGSQSKVDLNLLAKWFQNRKSSVGSNKTADELRDFINADSIPGMDVLAITGIDVDKAIKLTEDVSLIPYMDLPNSLTKTTFDKHSLPTFYMFYAPTAALICKNISQPKFTLEQPIPGHHSYTSRFLELNDICRCLTLIGPSAPMPFLNWWEPDECVPYFGVNVFGSVELKDMINRRVYPWTQEDIDKAPSLVQDYLGLSDETKIKLAIPIDRLNRAACRINLTDQAIELGVAVEALFLKGKRSDLTYRLKQRAAWFLATELSERKEIVELFGDLYECRSQAVHEGDVRSKVRNRDSNEIINKGAKKIAEAIEKIIINGWPAWDDIVLGSN